MMRVAGRNEDGVAKPFQIKNSGNLGTTLGARNEVFKIASGSVLSKKTSSVVNRASNLKDYSAIVVAVFSDTVLEGSLILNWYVQDAPLGVEEQYGKQVSTETIIPTLGAKYKSTGYLEIKGTQLSVVMVNSSDVPVDVTVTIMGIK